MKLQKLTLRLSQTEKIKYIKEYLDINGIAYTSDAGFSTITFVMEIKENDQCLFLQLVINLVLIFEKYQYVFSNISYDRKDGLDFTTFMGSILAFNMDEESIDIERALGDSDHINLNGLIDFGLEKLKDDWTELSMLSNRLLSEFITKENVYELTAYMLGMESYPICTIRLLNDEGYKVFMSGKQIPIPIITDDDDKNVLISMVRERPRSITIPDRDKFNPNLINSVKQLGK